MYTALSSMASLPAPSTWCHCWHQWHGIIASTFIMASFLPLASWHYSRYHHYDVITSNAFMGSPPPTASWHCWCWHHGIIAGINITTSIGMMALALQHHWYYGISVLVLLQHCHRSVTACISVISAIAITAFLPA